jgi:hypothetical protein
VGLRAPLGPVADEHNPVALSDGSLYCTYRTTEGYLCHAYSRDGGRTWTPPQYATYTPTAAPPTGAGGAAGGVYAPGQAPPAPSRRLKHPRAANFVKRFSNGRYLLWFHNHGGRWYQYRNPAWVCGGVERDGPDGKVIHWSEPEILLYDEDADARLSYPDFVEVPGAGGSRYFVTETQKTVARVHEIDRTLLEGVWSQHEHEQRAVVEHGLALSATGEACAAGARIAWPDLPDLRTGGGFSLDLWIDVQRAAGGQTLLDARDATGRGLLLQTAGALGNLTLRLTLDDGRTRSSWDSDPGAIPLRRPAHVVSTV